MGAQTRLTLTDLLYHLRQRLLDAAERHDQPSLVGLQITLVVLQEAAWESRGERLAALIEDMIGVTRDALTGGEWKSDVPGAEAIKALRPAGVH